MHKLAPLPEGPFRFLALDVETANYSAASICQIGIAAVRADHSIATWVSYIDPRDSFLSGNIAIHGIKPEQVAGAPQFAQAWHWLKPLLDKYTIFQHSTFDSRCFAAAAHVAGFELPDLAWSDSVTLARRVWPEFKGQGGHGLANLKKQLGLKFRHHDAGEDARAAAEVVLQAEAKTGEPYTNLIRTSKKKAEPTWFEPKIEREGDPAGPHFGEELVFTGALRISRELAAQKAAALGYRVAPKLGPKTTLVVEGVQDKRVVGAAGLSRTARSARQLQQEGQALKLMAGEDFLALLRAAGV